MMEDTASFRLARKISNLMIPPFFLLVVVTALIFAVPGKTGQKAVWWGISLVGAGFLPMGIIFAMYYGGKLSGKHLPLRRERTLPYLISIFCTAVTFALLFLTRAPSLFLAMMLVFLGNTAFLLVVNLWWKMSAHMMGAVGPVTILLWKWGLWALPLFALALLVGWSRIRLRAHTPSQVVAGGVAGVVLTYFQLVFWLRLLSG